MAARVSLLILLTDDECEALACIVAGEAQRTIELRLGKDEASPLEIRKSLI